MVPLSKLLSHICMGQRWFQGYYNNNHPGFMHKRSRKGTKPAAFPRTSQPTLPHVLWTLPLLPRRWQPGSSWPYRTGDHQTNLVPSQAPFNSTCAIPRCLCRKARAAWVVMSRHLWGSRVPLALKTRGMSFPVRKAKSVWLWCTDPLGKGRERV